MYRCGSKIKFPFINDQDEVTAYVDIVFNVNQNF